MHLDKLLRHKISEKGFILRILGVKINKCVQMVFFCTICLFISACGLQKDDSIIEKSLVISDETDSQKNGNGETKMDNSNALILAEVLECTEDDRGIRSITCALETIHAGNIQSAEAFYEDGERKLSIIAEDGTEYHVYLTRNGNVEAVEDINTGEWPIMAIK